MRKAFIALALLLFAASAHAQITTMGAGGHHSGVCPGSVNFAQDAFSGTGGTLLSAHTDDLGNSWTRIDAGTTDNAVIGAITSSTVASNGTTDNVVYMDSGVPPCANYTVTATVTVATPITAQHGVICRAASGPNFYLAIADYFNSLLRIYKNVSGTFTQLGGTFDISGVSSPWTLALTCNGTTISAAVNGTTQLSVTDSTFASAGKSGLLVNDGNGGSNLLTLSSFSAK